MVAPEPGLSDCETVTEHAGAILVSSFFLLAVFGVSGLHCPIHRPGNYLRMSSRQAVI